MEKLFDVINVRVISIHSLHFWTIHDGVVVFVLERIIVRIHCPSISSENNVCYLVPQEFLFDPMSKTYGDPRRRPEVRFGTVEYVATSDYMVRIINYIIFSMSIITI